ncbi:phasin family protein [Bradyrhizobium liaoningense]
MKEALEFNASCLQDQADYLKKLAESTNPADAVKCQLDFAQQCWSRSFGGAWRVFDSLRINTSSPRPTWQAHDSP